MDSSLQLYSELNPSERRVLLGEKRSHIREDKDYDKNLTFQPFVSDRSKMMARNKV